MEVRDGDDPHKRGERKKFELEFNVEGLWFYCWVDLSIVNVDGGPVYLQCGLMTCVNNYLLSCWVNGQSCPVHTAGLPFVFPFVDA